ncbi:(d)CMP kinase [Aerococcaceae bacterium DSM 111022]|nr:(d)CMP kinase [Aerococcaceae bacterium DSM 111022]
MTYQIAIDGPSSSGKSTVAQIIAKRLGITYIDTGAMYRAVTVAVLEENVNIENNEEIEKILSNIKIQFKWVENKQHIYLNDKDVSEKIRSTKVTSNVSAVSALKAVRELLVELQREIASTNSVAMDGRDIGTVVLPNAEYKFFFTADARVRAKRRFEENKAAGRLDQTLEELTELIIKRDKYDSNREISPLKQAEDAIVIDSTNMTVDEMVENVLGYIKH